MRRMSGGFGIGFLWGAVIAAIRNPVGFALVVLLALGLAAAAGWDVFGWVVHFVYR